MTYFPHNPPKRADFPVAKAFASVRQTLNRDILWDQPVFKAPALNPRIALDPLPFTAVRITQRSAQR